MVFWKEGLGKEKNMIIFTSLLCLFSSFVYCYQITETMNSIYWILFLLFMIVVSVILIIINKKQEFIIRRSVAIRQSVNSTGMFASAFILALLGSEADFMIKLIITIITSLFFVGYIVNSNYRPNNYNLGNIFVVISILNFIGYMAFKNIISFYLSIIIIALSFVIYLIRKKETDFSMFISSAFFAGLVIIFNLTYNIINVAFLIAPLIVIITTGEKVRKKMKNNEGDNNA